MREHRFALALRATDPVLRRGRVRRIFPTFIEADGPALPLGAVCAIEVGTPTTHAPRQNLLAEVARVDRDAVILVPFDDATAVLPGAVVSAEAQTLTVPVGDALLGRAIDGLGRPIDGRPLRAVQRRPLRSPPVTPLAGRSPSQTLETGVRAIDGLLTLGRGQRVGLFAASGVGKTMLMTQLIRQVQGERIVICLVGERGREVEALWGRGLPPEARMRATLVAATSDESAAMRVRACHQAIAIADEWRREGHDVILFLDSVTRLAMAMREIGLAAGEPPTTRAYPPSVFAGLPQIVERCGALKSGGSITAIMTVLSETDDVDDPIAELMKSLLDGHLILSRTLAEQGHFPAIDLPRSISRLARDLVDDAHRSNAERAVALIAAHEGARTLIEAGLYAKGASPDIDRAIEARPRLEGFLRQRPDERVSLDATRKALAGIIGALD